MHVDASLGLRAIWRVLSLPIVMGSSWCTTLGVETVKCKVEVLMSPSIKAHVRAPEGHFKGLGIFL